MSLCGSMRDPMAFPLESSRAGMKDLAETRAQNGEGVLSDGRLHDVMHDCGYCSRHHNLAEGVLALVPRARVSRSGVR
jgi:hypothetical protein